MDYQYTAKASTGETVTGLLDAPTPDAAYEELREQHLSVLSMKPAAGARGSFGGKQKMRGRSRVSKHDLLTLTSQLAIMTRAGVDLASSLGNLADQCTHPGLKAILDDIYEQVLSGKAVSVALQEYRSVFGNSYIAGMAAAEASGQLPEVLDRLAMLLRTDLRMRSTLRTLLAYPIVLASISVLVLAALVFFVLPQFAGVFKQLDIDLPAITRLLIAVSTELRGRFWLWGGLAAVALAGLLSLVFTQAGRRRLDTLLLNVVMVRDVTRALLIGRAFRLLSTMLESGVPLLDGLRLTRSSISNSLMREMFDTLEEEVVNGRGLANTFLSSPFVPPAAAQMIATAERTGTLAAVTRLMGDFYEEDGETRLRELATVLEPIIIVVMGVIVAFVVMSVMLPVFDFATAAR